ncbi:hypothetical protein HDU76_009529 [Blyttiomyces sp. JEL0837]|nr:hypothetical protein HDU76_009529 [Blyttiomyces sp. JEL0837]
MGIDKDTIMGVINKAKSFIGLKTKPHHEEKAENQEELAEAKKDAAGVFKYVPEVFKSPSVLTFMTNVLLAMAMTKLFLPIKLTVVAFVTPTVAKRLRAMGFDFGKRGYRDMAKDARGRYQERKAEWQADRAERAVERANIRAMRAAERAKERAAKQ